ncbi:hypothetical protein Q0M94_13290 [Deinococcus radiomollis]|uniref:hypothetical protein n=1 Tax=Deinococcus radiomollis TaxID=468916 RepID=UPI00389282C9
MGAFDILVFLQKCEQCGNEIQKKFQFKYGTPWQRKFSLGDKLTWEGNPIRYNGLPLSGLIAADAVLEECPICGHDDEWSVIYLLDNVFVGADSNDGRYRFVQVGQPYALSASTTDVLKFQRNAEELE